MAALNHLDPRYAPQYYEHAYRLASPDVRRRMEEIMESTAWPVYSPFARKHYGKGEEVGRVKGEAAALLTVLEVRGIPVSERIRERITACRDLVKLDMWLRRSATAESIEDLFPDSES